MMRGRRNVAVRCAGAGRSKTDRTGRRREVSERRIVTAAIGANTRSLHSVREFLLTMLLL